jgi:hypothetical protein
MQRCAALRHDSFRFDSFRFCSARSATATATTAPTRAKTPPSRTAESQTRHAVGRSAVQRRTETPLPFTHHRTRQTRLALTTSFGNTQVVQTTAMDSFVASRVRIHADQQRLDLLLKQRAVTVTSTLLNNSPHLTRKHV